MFLNADSLSYGKMSDDSGYGTAGTTTQTTLASQGGLLINIDSATGDIARTTDGWIEDEKYGWYYESISLTNAGEFDTAVTRTGAKTLKLSTTNATGTCFAHTGDNRAATYVGTKNKLFPIKSSTKYRSSVWVKTNNIVSGSVNFRVWTWDVNYANRTDTFVANTLSGTNDWTLLTREFTTNAGATYGMFEITNQLAGNISDAWFDVNSMTLEEVVEPVANSLTSSSPSLVSFTAVGSTDNIDQSLDPTFAAANTYTPPTAISETATNKQTFVPTKSKMTRIGVYPVAKGTGNWTVTVHDASNVVQASITIANASLTNGAVNYFNVPCNLTAGATYHFHVTSTVADGTVRVATASDLETVSYIQNYYKPTTNFKASQNNLSVSISADEDGFLDGSIINLTTGAYSWGMGATPTDLSMGTNVFRSTAGPGTAVGSQTIIQNYGFYNYNSKNWIGTGATTSTLDLVWKCETILPITSDVVVSLTAITRTTGDVTVAFSTDDSVYTDLGSLGNSSNVQADFSYSTSALIGVTKFYIRVRRSGASSKFDISNLAISTTVNPSSLSTLRNYPTNKDIIKQYSTTLGAATTTATYRATKWGFPAIEYSSTEYQYLDVDTTATGSTVAFSELGTSYTTVADGASLAISSTSTPNIFVKANITANRLYLSSNDYNANSDKDGSMKETVVYQVVQ